jgi:hypothetical protein
MSRGFLQMLASGSRWRGFVAALALATAVSVVSPEASAQPVRTGVPQRPADPPSRAPVRPGGGAQNVANPARTNENPAAGRVKVSMMVVYANNSGQVDPRLRGLQQQLEMMKFTGYQVLSTHSATLGTSQDQSFPIEGGRRMEVTVVSFSETQARVRIELFKGTEKTIDTTVNIRNGRTLVTGGPKYQAGSLIFPITVSY